MLVPPGQTKLSIRRVPGVVQKGEKLLTGQQLLTETSSRVTESGDRKEEQAEERLW